MCREMKLAVDLVWIVNQYAGLRPIEKQNICYDKSSSAEWQYHSSAPTFFLIRKYLRDEKYVQDIVQY